MLLAGLLGLVWAYKRRSMRPSSAVD
jgi:hypothetical protein